MDKYIPIACVAHERLEFAVLRRQRLRLRVRDETGAEIEQVVLPTDVATHDQAEWLSYQTSDGASGIVRLDRILSVKPI